MNRKSEVTGVFMLLLASIIWGAAFVAQSVGAEYVEAFTFLASRSVIGVIVLIPAAFFLKRKEGSEKEPPGKEPASSGTKSLLAGGAVCGLFLFLASAAQQIGIAYTTTAKSGFLTAMYVVIVPVIYAIIRRKSSLKIWICMAIAVAGLYLLCIKEELSLGFGDLITLLCAVLFSIQIMCLSYFVKKADGIRLTIIQFATVAVLSAICMLLFEHPTWEGLQKALVSILYAGVLSSGVGYTLQTLGQARVNPATASLVMSLESVFSALAGWIILGQGLTFREIAGCALMFAAIVLTELPIWKSE